MKEPVDYEYMYKMLVHFNKQDERVKPTDWLQILNLLITILIFTMLLP